MIKPPYDRPKAITVTTVKVPKLTFLYFEAALEADLETSLEAAGLGTITMTAIGMDRLYAV